MRQFPEFINKEFFILETAHGKRVTLKPEFGRHYSSLRAEIYYSAVQTLIVVMISVGILAFATRTPAVNQLVISGFALGVFNITSLLFGARELVMSGKFVVPAFAIGGLATLTFFCALLIFLWRFPSPINRFAFGKLVAAWALFVSSAQYFQYFEFPIDPYQIPFLLIFLPASIICIIQWRNAHHYPLEHASIIWFSLIIIGVTGFGMLGLNIPVMLG